jgi:hypothetical protein
MGHRYGVAAVLLVAALCGCASDHYQNVNHSNYGDAEYNADLAQCRKDNTKVTTTQGYDVQIHTDVDEAKAASCMTARGWQKVAK